MAECKPLELGGRTVENPCLGAYGWVCTPWDYWATRKILQTERNVLVDRLTALNQLTKAGKASWSDPLLAASSQAYELANGASYDLLMEYSDSNWNIFRGDQAAEEPARMFIQMAQRVHAATCDVEAALATLGQTVPQAPAPPPAPQKIEDRVLEFTLQATKTAALGIAVVLGGLYAYKRISR